MLVTAHMYLHGHVHQEHCCHGTLRLAVPLVGPKLCVRLQNLQQALLTSQTKSKIKNKNCIRFVTEKQSDRTVKISELISTVPLDK